MVSKESILLHFVLRLGFRFLFMLKSMRPNKALCGQHIVHIDNFTKHLHYTCYIIIVYILISVRTHFTNISYDTFKVHRPVTITIKCSKHVFRKLCSVPVKYSIVHVLEFVPRQFGFSLRKSTDVFREPILYLRLGKIYLLPKLLKSLRFQRVFRRFSTHFNSFNSICIFLL